MWLCPQCDRQFERAHQSHVCVPGCTVEECFAPYPATWREIHDRLMDHLESLGPIHADVVRVGVFVKQVRKLAEIRPKARSLSLTMAMPRTIEDDRIARVYPTSGDRHWHFIKLTDPDDVDNQLRDWLTEAYDAAS